VFRFLNDDDTQVKVRELDEIQLLDHRLESMVRGVTELFRVDGGAVRAIDPAAIAGLAKNGGDVVLRISAVDTSGIDHSNTIRFRFR
jgi:hypothetical protein